MYRRHRARGRLATVKVNSLPTCIIAHVGSQFIKNRRLENMADKVQRILDVGSACLLADEDFTSGHITGWLQFYDERYRPMFPLTSSTVCEYLMSFVNDNCRSESWRMGAVVGWCDALCENSSETFKSVLAGDHLSVVREVAP